MKKNNHNLFFLFLDFGNSNVKIFFYSKDKKRLLKSLTISNDCFFSNFSKYIKQIRTYCQQIWGLFYLSTNSNKLIPSIISLIKKEYKPNIFYNFNNFQYSKYLKLNTIKNKQQVGADIILIGAFLASHYKNVILFNLGTIYFNMYIKNKNLIGCCFVPSFLKPLFVLPKKAQMSSKCFPIKDVNCFGTSTDEAYIAGINDAMKGWIQQSINKIKTKNNLAILFSGQDAKQFAAIKNKYQIDTHLNFKAMVYFANKIFKEV